MQNKVNIKILANVALLIALEVVLSRFLSISTPIVKIGFSFVPIAFCAIMYGPVWAGVAAALGDIIGATLFPIGAFFPGFTLSAALTGVVFGLFLYNRKGNWAQLVGAVSINCIGISLLLSTFWLTIITGTSFWVLLPTRIVQNLIMIPAEFIVLRLLQKPVGIYIRKEFAR
jgi:ECF transporter S component (folate family)